MPTWPSTSITSVPAYTVGSCGENGAVPAKRLLTAAVFATTAAVLVHFTDSTVPYGDSFTTALSITALWMLSRKYAEQWLVWIAVDIVSAGLYFYKGLCPTGVLYTLYAVAAVAGYFKWLKMMKNGKTTLPDA